MGDPPSRGTSRPVDTDGLTDAHEGSQPQAPPTDEGEGTLARSVAEAGLNAFGCVFVELWVIAEDGTRLCRPHDAQWMDPAFAQSLPNESLAEKALGLAAEAGDCPPGAGLAGTLSEESQNKGGVHWRQINGLLTDPFVQRGSGKRMERWVELGVGLVGTVSFNLRAARGIVLFFSRSTASADLLRSPANEQYMLCSADLIAANFAVRKSQTAASERRRALFVSAIQKVRKQLVTNKLSIGAMAMDKDSMAELKSLRAREAAQNIEDLGGGRGARLAERARHLGKQGVRRVNNSRRKWRGAGLHGPPRQSLCDCCFVLVGVFFTMLAMLKIAGALGEADSRFGFHASWYSSTLCIVYALTPAPVGQPRQILAAHLWNMLVGLACRQLPSGAAALVWKQALAVALGVSGQAFVGILHPPATGLSLAFASDPQWTWTTLVAVCMADVVVVLISMAYLNMSETKQFPLYWLGVDKRDLSLLFPFPATRGARSGQKGATTVHRSAKGHKSGGDDAV